MAIVSGKRATNDNDSNAANAAVFRNSHVLSHGAALRHTVTNTIALIAAITATSHNIITTA